MTFFRSQWPPPTVVNREWLATVVAGLQLPDGWRAKRDSTTIVLERYNPAADQWTIYERFTGWRQDGGDTESWVLVARNAPPHASAQELVDAKIAGSSPPLHGPPRPVSVEESLAAVVADAVAGLVGVPDDWTVTPKGFDEVEVRNDKGWIRAWFRVDASEVWCAPYGVGPRGPHESLQRAVDATVKR